MKFSSHARPPPLSPLYLLSSLNFINIHSLPLEFTPPSKSIPHVLTVLQLFSLYQMVVVSNSAINDDLESLTEESLGDQTGVG